MTHVPCRAVVLSNAAVELVAATGKSVDARGCSKIERRDRSRTSAVLAGNIGGAYVVVIASVTVGGDTKQGSNDGGSCELSIGAAQS